MTEDVEELRERLLTEAASAAEEWDSAEGPGEPVRSRTRTTSASQVYSVRIPVDQLQRLRALADARGVGASVLMRDWVVERLDRETAGEGAPGERLSALLSEAQRILQEHPSPTAPAGALEPGEPGDPSRTDRQVVRLGRRSRHLVTVLSEPDDAATSAQTPKARRERGGRR